MVTAPLEPPLAPVPPIENAAAPDEIPAPTANAAHPTAKNQHQTIHARTIVESKYAQQMPHQYLSLVGFARPAPAAAKNTRCPDQYLRSA